RHRWRAHVRGGLGRGVLRDGTGREPAGFRLMDVALPSGETVQAHDFFVRARARLALDVPAALNDPTAQAKRGDLDLDPVICARAPVVGARAGGRGARRAGGPPRVAARPEPQVLLTQRTELPSHPGQIAFPGGKIEANDATPAAAAMREADEEIGLKRGLIEPI